MPFFLGALWRESWLLLLLLGLLAGPSWEPVEFLRSLMSSWLTVCRAPLCSLSKRKDLGEGGGDVSHFIVVLSSRTSSWEAGNRVTMPSLSTSQAGLCRMRLGVD